MRRISRLRRILQARKKTGRKTFSYTVALTPEQIQWLTERYTNSSELIRRLLDDHIKAVDKAEPEVVKLGYKFKRLIEERKALGEEQMQYMNKYPGRRIWPLGTWNFKEGVFEFYKDKDETLSRLSESEREGIEETIDTFSKVMEAYHKNIQLLDQQIEELRQKINLLNKQT